jgi:hypothetical protein
MAAGGKPTDGGPRSTRVPGLLALVVVAPAYQQSPYVPAQLETGLHVAVPILGSRRYFVGCWAHHHVCRKQREGSRHDIGTEQARRRQRDLPP